MTTSASEHSALVRAWAAQLRAGSTQRWSDFREGATPAAGDGPVPGGAQLEVVRRLDKELGAFDELADLIFATAGPGRGRVDVPLPGGPAGFGFLPTEPDALPADELIRIIRGALVTLLTRDVPPARQPDRSWSPRLPWRRSVVVLGAPLTAAALRAELREHGIREGGRRPTCVVVGGPLDQLMAERWSARVSAGGEMRWQRMWETAVAQDRLPPGIQLGTLANGLVEQFGAAHVHVVLAADPEAACATAGAVLGLDLALPSPRPGSGLLATDLLRGLNALLVMKVGEDGRDRIADQVWPELAGVEARTALAAPRGRVGWARTTAEAMAEELRSGDYAVHGDPGIVVPVHDTSVRRRVEQEDVLEFGLGVLGRAWTRDLGRGSGPTERQG